jgi:NAD+-dependent secondary alcohol dehydrogenase Adh1
VGGGDGPDLPYTIGHENAGWVHEVGSGVTNVAPGDTVILHPQPSCGLCLACRAGRDMQCEDAFFPGLSNNDGGMAEYLRTTARACVKLTRTPTRLTSPRSPTPASPPTTRCARPCRCSIPAPPRGAGRRRARPHRHPVLAALTATKIIVVDRNPDALALAKQIGADEAVLADGSHVDAVKELTGGNGANVVFDFVAEQGAEQDAWQMTAPAGSQFVIGYGGEFRAPTLDFVGGEKNVIGNIVGTYNDLAELMVLAQAGKVTLHTRQYPLDAAVEALDDLDNGRVRGRAILVP